MIQTESRVIVADNTGAKTALVIGILKGTGARKATVGDKVKVAIKSASSSGQVKNAEVHTAIVVRTRKEIKRRDGSYIRFADNAIALIDKNTGSPLGKKIFGPVALEVKSKWYKDIANLADEII